MCVCVCVCFQLDQNCGDHKDDKDREVVLKET